VLAGLNDRETVRVIGIFTSVKRISDKKGRPMAFAQIEDLHGSTEVLIFSEAYDRHQGLIAPDTVVMLEGSISKGMSRQKLLQFDGTGGESAGKISVTTGAENQTAHR
jgi:DNA polymerase III subunit alpha